MCVSSSYACRDAMHADVQGMKKAFIHFTAETRLDKCKVWDDVSHLVCSRAFLVGIIFIGICIPWCTQSAPPHKTKTKTENGLGYPLWYGPCTYCLHFFKFLPLYPLLLDFSAFLHCAEEISVPTGRNIALKVCVHASKTLPFLYPSLSSFKYLIWLKDI